MQVLVTGASGLLGRAVVKEFVRAGHATTGIVYSRAPPTDSGAEYRKCDLRDYDAFLAIVQEVKPTVIVHCAAEKKPDVCANDPERATTMNVTVTENVAKAAADVESWIILISTDYVFDGKRSTDGKSGPPYKANAAPSPLNLYGQTKVQAEAAVRRIKHDAGILRVGVLYGECDDLAESAVTALLATARASAAAAQPVVVDDWAQRYPTHTGDVAHILRGLAERKSKYCGLYGTWHWCGAERTTKFELATLLAELAGVTGVRLARGGAPEASAAPRPEDVQLDTSAIELMGLGRHTPLKSGLAAVLASSSASNDSQ